MRLFIWLLLFQAPSLLARSSECEQRSLELQQSCASRQSLSENCCLACGSICLENYPQLEARPQSGSCAFAVDHLFKLESRCLDLVTSCVEACGGSTLSGSCELPSAIDFYDQESKCAALQSEGRFLEELP